MTHEHQAVRRLYKGLLAFYPRTFREQLAESMEQTFSDLCTEKRQTKTELFSFVLSTFFDTAVGILREHLLLVSRGGIMQTLLKTVGAPALFSILFILPLAIMEVVNRRNFNEDFPTFLFFIMWLNLFAVIVILLPIMVSRRAANPAPIQEKSLLTNPRSAVILSIALILAPGILPLMDSLGWLSVNHLINGPNPEVTYLPGAFLTLVLILFPIAAGVVAGRPIVSTLRAGGSLFAHPIHLIIVVILSFLFASGLVSLIVDQWPCFIGVPTCD
jgi:hypothetical protein